MSEAPETIWAWCEVDDRSYYKFWISNAAKRTGEETEYRRADLPATDEQAFANPKVKALVEALRDIAETGDEYADGWDAKVCGNTARAALAAMKETDDETK